MVLPTIVSVFGVRVRSTVHECCKEEERNAARSHSDSGLCGGETRERKGQEQRFASTKHTDIHI